MQYRKFGPLDWQVSALGFGAMRLPVVDRDQSRIHEAEATAMLHYAIDHGVNYVDTAYAYHGGTSESFLGRALQGSYRERVRLATKLPSWQVEKAEDFDRYLDEQLERLRTDCLDFYLLHNLNAKVWAKLRDLGVLRWAEQAMASGRFRHFGFSFHDRYEVFREIVDATDLWTLCQIQYNYMDEQNQAGRQGLRYAAGKGLAVVVMEPIRGGSLARRIPPQVQALWDEAPVQRTPAEWALLWVWNQPEVAVALSGMSTMRHVVENVASADRSGPGALTEEELALIARVREAYIGLRPVPCTDCGYCQPCPQGVSIPRIFEIYNDAFMYSYPDRARAFYTWLRPDERADQCIACGECEEKCPQHIAIPDVLEQAHAFLSLEGGA